jgi:hypothetical protein
MDETYKQFLAEEERLFQEWRRADEAAAAAEEAAKAKMEKRAQGGPELTLEECDEILRLRQLASKAALAVITHSRSRPI